MAAAIHPQELKKVQAQLDEVVGRERCTYNLTSSIANMLL